MAMYVVAGRGTKKDCRTCKIGGLSPAAGGYALQDRAVAHGIVAKRGRVVGGHVTRRDGVHVNPLGSPFIRKCAGKLHYPALCRSIGRDQDSALKGKHGGNVQYFPTSALLEHLSRSELGEPEHGSQIDGNHLIPIFGRIVGGGRAP